MWRLRVAIRWEGRDGLIRARRWVVRFSILRYVFLERDDAVEFSADGVVWDRLFRWTFCLRGCCCEYLLNTCDVLLFWAFRFSSRRLHCVYSSLHSLILSAMPTLTLLCCGTVWDRILVPPAMSPLPLRSQHKSLTGGRIDAIR